MALFKKIEQRPFLKKEFVPVPNICRDPNDDMIIACAIDAAADYIVTGDEDLLTLKRYKDIVIINPRNFEALFAD